VQASAQWRDIQPLSTQWLAEKQILPARLVEGDQRNWVQDMPVRAEHFSLHTWAPLAFHDVGAWKIGLAYQSIHSLPAGSNLAAHFYQQCGLPALAERAAQADVGVFSYGAIFAVRNRRLQAFVAQHAEQLPRMIALTRSQETHGYMFERAWLHLFGEPFARLAALSEVPLPAVTSPASAARPAATVQDTVSALRTQALAASQAGQADEAVALLQQALQIDPGHVEAIADLAALALNQGIRARPRRWPASPWLATRTTAPVCSCSPRPRKGWGRRARRPTPGRPWCRAPPPSAWRPRAPSC
jgi:hypothetical protein